jgi:glutamate N-acetyltransferase/amino-acid N-acetyltransferase
VDAVTVTAPAGFIAAGGFGQVKKEGLDLSLVVAEGGPVAAAGVFTRNTAAAAPVLLSRRRLRGGRAQAVVINSGCANAGTGPNGLEDAERITSRLAALLAIDPETVLMCSTGPIGSRLPVDSMLSALPGLVADATPAGGERAAEAILTTDTRSKTVVVRGDGFLVGGMAKGAAMIRPDLATMLCLLTTDAQAEPAALQQALAAATQTTFNSLNVDGCESTNDSVILLASGQGPRVSEGRLAEAVAEACGRLAYQMAADAEGASRVVMLQISGANDDDGARRLGRSIADSALVRSSFYGGDPNWGRILSVLGSSRVDPAGVRIAYAGVVVADRGVGLPFDDQELAKRLTGDFVVEVEVGSGPGRARVVTTDLTPEYVRFNGERS